MNTTYIIQNVQKITFNGRQVKTFKAYKQCESGLVFQGTFTADVRTANKNLHLFINA
jgi:hypothetical protein